MKTKTQYLNKTIMLLLAIGCGLIVANLYYIQPLLSDIAKTFNVTPSSVGFIAMLVQFGYALGIILITPIADLVEKKKLIIIISIFSIFFLNINGYLF